jgi:phosphohistidine phosphatase
VRVYLIHHADAVGPDVDSQRPLSAIGHEQAEKLAQALKDRQASPPLAIWHSGKLRARQTGEAMLRHWAPFATFTMVRGLGPDDSPEILAATIRGEGHDLAIVGHMPHLPWLLSTLTGTPAAVFPAHGAVALESHDGGRTWKEVWRIR